MSNGIAAPVVPKYCVRGCVRSGETVRGSMSSVLVDVVVVVVERDEGVTRVRWK
jgi:hypothetical protein